MGIQSKEKLIKMILSSQRVLKATRAKVYLEDLFKFNTEVLGVEKASGAVPLSQAHREMCKFIDTDPQKYKLLLFPRGHLKSTLVTVAHTVRHICKNPKVRVLIANATYGLATSFLGQIKAHLKGNKKIHELYGDFSSGAGKWSEDEIKVFKKGEDIDYEKKEPTVKAMGITGSLTSQHYDVIIIDDGVNRENIGTIDQIRKVYKFYMDCLDLLDPGGELIIIGTRWHDIDLYGWIMLGDNEREGEIPKSIAHEIMPHQFVFKGTQFNIMKRKIVEGTTPIWPVKFTPQHIEMLKKQKSPYEFSTQYNNEPIPEEDQQFKRSWFRYYKDDDIARRNLFTFSMVDPAISQESGADFTVIATVSLDEYYNWYIREIIRDHFLPNEIIDQMFRTYERFHPIEMGLEVVAYQKMLAYALRDEMKDRKKFLPIRELKQSTRTTKESRIKSLQPGYFNGKIFHKERMVNLEYLEDELLRFPRGTHDDIIDALSSLTQFAVPPKSERKKVKQSTYLY